MLAALAAGGLLALVASPALAAEGSIDHVESHDGTVQVLYSTSRRRRRPTLDTLQVRLDGKPLEATATARLRRHRRGPPHRRAGDRRQRQHEGRREVRGGQAGRPDLPRLGPHRPVRRHRHLRRQGAGGPAAHARPRPRRGGWSAGSDSPTAPCCTTVCGRRWRSAASGGSAACIVLSDGRDTSRTQLSAVTDQIKRADTKVDVVALAQSAREKALLSPLSTAGHGAVISADDPRALGRVFASEARSLAQQILITAKTPAGAGGGHAARLGQLRRPDLHRRRLRHAVRGSGDRARRLPHRAGSRADGLHALRAADARRPRGPRARAAGRDGRPVRRVRPAEGVAGEPDRGLHPAGPRQARLARVPRRRRA